MSRRSLVAAIAVVVSAVAGVATVQAAPVTVHPESVQISRGHVTIVQTRLTGQQEYDYQVTFTGPLAVHGWTHTGTLSGKSVAVVWETFTDNIPAFSVASPDGVVTGQCGGSPDNLVDDSTGAGVSDLLNRHGFSFDCDLSHNGGSRWDVNISTNVQAQELSPNTTQFSGTYRLVDAESSLVGINKNVTYGDAQLADYTGPDGGIQWGPLTFSGQMMIGSVRYVGDVVSDVGPYVYSGPIPDMAVSGTSNGLHVTGTCGGNVDRLFSQVETTYDFVCRLRVNGGALVTVPLRAVMTSGGGRCSGRECWGDDDGYFLAR